MGNSGSMYTCSGRREGVNMYCHVVYPSGGLVSTDVFNTSIKCTNFHYVYPKRTFRTTFISVNCIHSIVTMNG